MRGWDLISRACELQLTAHFSAATALCLAAAPPPAVTSSTSSHPTVLLSAGRDQIVHMTRLSGKAKAVSFAAHESLEALGVVDGRVGTRAAGSSWKAGID